MKLIVLFSLVISLPAFSKGGTLVHNYDPDKTGCKIHGGGAHYCTSDIVLCPGEHGYDRLCGDAQCCTPGGNTGELYQLEFEKLQQKR